jgi:2',3'-cyclic-nucleotide 2'-phosphodiesterase (5'-nucleotidase family)
MKLNYIVCALLLSACSFKKSQLVNQSQKGHTELYSEPAAANIEPTGKIKRIVIASTNDIQGIYQENTMEFEDRHHNQRQSIKVGGIDYISSYLKILRKNFKSVLLLDSGDLFSSKTQELDYISEFYSTFEYDAVTVGLQDFNLKLPAKYHSSSDLFKDFAKKSKTSLILSNLFELKTARVVEWPGTLPYLMREVNGVKVGIIGLIPDDIVALTPIDNRIGLYVETMLQSTLRNSRLLRSLGADIIVVMTHQGLNCGESIAQDLKLPITKVNFDQDQVNVCDLSSKLGAYLNRLPPGLVDVIIGGRTHQKMANIINGTVLMSGFENGTSLSYTEIFVDQTNKIVKNKTVVHQPVMICQEFFKESKDCYTEDPSVDHKVRVPAFFLGEKVESDTSVKKKFNYYLKNNTTKVSPLKRSLQSIMDFYEGDISYSYTENGESKLLLLTLKGSEVISILEDDFNQGLAAKWMPSPFEMNEETLSITISGQPIESEKDYSILTDLDSAQKHFRLKKIISRSSNKSLNHVSWNEPAMDSDNISSVMAASEAVR